MASRSNSSNHNTKKVSKRDQAWETMFSGLVLYREQHGNFDVPRNYKHSNKCLYDWMRKQREGYRNSLKQPKLWPCLSAARIARFRDIGFDLTVNGRYLSLHGYQEPLPSLVSIEHDRQNRSKSYSKQWDMMYQGLLDYKAKNHNSLNVPRNYMVGTKNLFLWLQAQRQYYRTYLHVSHKPTPWESRMRRLREIGFDLPITKADHEVEVELVDEENGEGEFDVEEPELRVNGAAAANASHDASSSSLNIDINQPSQLPSDHNDAAAAEPAAKKQRVQLPQHLSEDQQHEHLHHDEHDHDHSFSPIGDLNQSTDPNVAHDALALLAGAATEPATQN
ncbi:hypothetical protein MPSEU_000423600 [Mayamaea pseudoterrestris]|nr:hypothetical protein MPSEU_000423600 [Mayamaea pseudoterrestris]